MQRWLSTLLGAAALLLLVVVAVRTMSEHSAAKEPIKDTAAHDAAKPEASPSAAAPSSLADLAPVLDMSPRDTTGAFSHFPDGRPVPPLPDNAPKQVRFGVVLLTFAGAQGAPPNARSKADALSLATKLAQDAKGDFHAAAIRGDSGSADDMGHLPRGVLEPAVEYALFTLPVGSVSDPIETPRGYWIAKRIE